MFEILRTAHPVISDSPVLLECVFGFALVDPGEPPSLGLRVAKQRVIDGNNVRVRHYDTRHVSGQPRAIHSCQGGPFGVWSRWSAVLLRIALRAEAIEMFTRSRREARGLCMRVYGVRRV